MTATDGTVTADMNPVEAWVKPRLLQQDRIIYDWQATGPSGGGHFRFDLQTLRHDFFWASLPDSYEVYCTVKDTVTGYSSATAHKTVVVGHPSMQITYPPDSAKFTFSGANPGVLSCTTAAAVTPAWLADSLEWSITPIQGSNLTTIPDPPRGDTIIFRFENLPAQNNEFGRKYSSAFLLLRNGGDSVAVKDSVLVRAFYPKDATNNPDTLHDWANWFHYWRQDTIVASLDSVQYDSTLTDSYGVTINDSIWVGPAAATIHYDVHGDTGYTINNINFGGSDVNGMDCAAEVVAHEKYHRWVYLNWAAGGAWYGQTDTDGDRLPDNYENTVSHTSPDSSDTHHVAIIRQYPSYEAYGDQEYMAMFTANGLQGNHSRDWSAGLHSKQWP